MTYPIATAMLIFIFLFSILRIWNKQRRGMSLSRLDTIVAIITAVCTVISVILQAIPYLTNYQIAIPVTISVLLWILFVVSITVFITIVIRIKRWRSIKMIERVNAVLFFPKLTPTEHIKMDYHQKHLHHRLIINFKTTPYTAYYMTAPHSYGWKFIKKYSKWVREIVSLEDYVKDDPDFTMEWCKKKGYNLKPWDASKKELLETD